MILKFFESHTCMLIKSVRLNCALIANALESHAYDQHAYRNQNCQYHGHMTLKKKFLSISEILYHQGLVFEKDLRSKFSCLPKKNKVENKCKNI